MNMISNAVLISCLGMFIGECTANGINLNFQQQDYQLKFERGQLVSYNKSYFKEASMFTYKYNRTTLVLNMTFNLIRDLGNDMTVIMQAYKFMSNEYRMFPLHFALEACKAIAANTIGVGTLMNCGNFTGCPIMKGKLHMCNWQPDQKNFPPFIPNGEYKVELQCSHLSTEIAVVELFAVISRPIPIL